MRLTLSNQELFVKKVIILFIATIALVPLIRYKLIIPALVYIGGLLALHLFFFYLYFINVPWKAFLKDKKSLVLRLTGVFFLIYLLTIIKFQGNTVVVLLNIAAAFTVHLLILLFMMTLKVSYTGDLRIVFDKVKKDSR